MSARITALRARAGTGILIVAALSLGRVITERLPGADLASRPFTTAASINENVELRTGTVKVTRVQGSTKMANSRMAGISAGVWVVVDYTWTPSRESNTPLGARIASGANTWTVGLGRNQRLCSTSVPGVPVHCSVAIEVPHQQLVGARLQLYPELAGPTYDSMANIDLGITPEQSRTWALNETILDVPDARFETP